MSDAGAALLDPDIAAYYDRSPEEGRLGQGTARIEFARTRELIRGPALPPPAVVLDVGGGTGPYARWMAELGYEVQLLDPVERLVEVARRWADGGGREAMLRVVRTLEREPTLLGVSAQLLAVGRRPMHQ